MDLILEGKTYRSGVFEPCCIGIKQGKIAAIKKIIPGEPRRVFKEQLILPAGIDVHVHFRDPGFVQKEDFLTGSQAAAYGGISCVFDMPNTKPQTVTTRTLLDKISIAEKKSCVDFGIYAGVTDTNIDQIPDLSNHCSGFKIYLGSTTNALRLSEHHLSAAFQQISKSQKPVFVHAESEQCLQRYKMVESSLHDHLRSHPALCEEHAIKQVLHQSKSIPARIHLCHLSSCEGVNMVKSKPKTMSAGVTMHHLLLDTDTVSSHQTLYKVNPPIRSSLDKEALWDAVKNGNVDLIESDHAPHTLAEKEVEFADAPSGMPGVETMYPLLLALAKQGRLPLEKVISLVCEKPAELMRLSKGRIEVGRDADIIVIDFKKLEKINAERLHSKCGWTAFEGWHAIFPSSVFIRGEPVIEEDELLVKPGFGIHTGG